MTLKSVLSKIKGLSMIKDVNCILLWKPIQNVDEIVSELAAPDMAS